MKSIKYDLLNTLEKGKVTLFTPIYENLYTPNSKNTEAILVYKDNNLVVEKIVGKGNNYIPLNGCILSFAKDSIQLSEKDKLVIVDYEYKEYFNSLINQDNKRCVIDNYNTKNYGSSIVLLDRKFTIFTLPTTNYYEMVLKLDNITRGFIVNTNNYKEYRSNVGREIDKGSYVLFANESNDSFYKRFKINDQVHFEFPMVVASYEKEIHYTDYNPTGKNRKIGDVSVFAFREADTCMIYDIDGESVDKKTRMTGTNPWGHEVAVDSTGTIVDSNTNVAIPDCGYVISGVSDYYYILKNYFKVGSEVSIDKKKKKVVVKYNHFDASIFQYEKNLKEIEAIVNRLENEFYDYDKDLIYKYYKKYLPLKEKLQNRKTMYQYSQDTKEKLYHLYRFDGYFNKSLDYYNQLFKLSIPTNNVQTRACWHEPHEKTLKEVCDHLDTLKASNFNEFIVGGVMIGGVIFKSSIMQVNDFVNGYYGEEYGDDYLKCLVSEAKKRNIKVQISSDNFFIAAYFLKENFAKYKDLVALDYNGEIGQYGNGEITLFFDPVNPKAQQLILDIYKELLDNYEIDGLQLDYIRYCIGNDNYLTSFGYNEDSVALFKKQYGYEGDIHELVKEEKIFADFCEFRRNALTDFVGKVRTLVDNYNNIQLSIAVVSDYQFAKNSKLQDWVTWCDRKYINGIYLMAYHIGAEPVYDECIKAKKLVNNNKVFVYGGIAPIFNGCNINMVLQQVESIVRSEVDGISLFAFHSFQNRPDLYFYFNNNGPFKEPALAMYEAKDEIVNNFIFQIQDKCNRIFIPNRLIDEEEMNHLINQVRNANSEEEIKDITYIANPKARLHIDSILRNVQRYYKNKM